MKYKIDYILTNNTEGSITTEIDKEPMRLKIYEDVLPLICEKHNIQVCRIYSAIANPMEREE